MNEDEARTLTAIKQSVYYRNYRRARDRALVRLAQAYPEQYRSLFEEEKARDEAEGKTWTSSGTSIIPPDDGRVRPRTHTILRHIEANTDEQSKSNVEGEE
jgi:hypothetical protein